MLACRLPNLAPSYQASNVVSELLAAKADTAAKAKSNLTALHVAAESPPPHIKHLPTHTLADSHTLCVVLTPCLLYTSPSPRDRG